MAPAGDDPLTLAFDRPAQAWTEALPVGNGRLGAMVFGGRDGSAAGERLQLNEESVWDGFPRDRNNPAAPGALRDVRRLLFEGRNQEATELAEQTMLATPLRVDSYQPLADLFLEPLGASGVGAATDETRAYRRTLSLAEAVAAVDYASGGASFRREVFASAVDDVVVARVTCDRSARLHLRVRLEREQHAQTRLEGGDLLLTGRCGDDPRTVRFACRVRVLADGAGASVRADGNALVVDGADALTVLIAGATDFRRPWLPEPHEPEDACRDVLQRAAQKGYEALRADHVADHTALFGRVKIDLGDDPVAHEVARQFQVNRYFLVAASRMGCLPSNLQGIWNEKLKAPWNSDYHPNINLQMNYWPAEAANLAECHAPVFDWLEQIVVPNGRDTARKTYGCGGWTLHHVSDIFGCAEPMDGIWGLWPVGGAWLVRHLWEHYLYTRDGAFLRDRAWPLMRDAARFLLDFLVEAPPGTPVAGRLVTNPSHSPENAFTKPDGTVSKFTYAATMDLQIARDLFTSCVTALQVLGSLDGQASDPEADLKHELIGALERLAPLQISPRDGRLQEWVEDYDEPQPGHRHISHMYGVYPAHEITPEQTPERAEAARKSLERRLASDYDAQAWSLHWMACVWARLGDGERAMEALSRALAHHTLPNRMVDAHGHAQVGDAPGLAAAVCEMLVQSAFDPSSGQTKVTLLPALPAAWREGSVRGLRTRGGYEVDLSWKDGRLERYALRPEVDGTVRVSVAPGREAGTA
jgi:alpha-L-fucosidase 2